MTELERGGDVKAITRTASAVKNIKAHFSGSKDIKTHLPKILRPKKTLLVLISLGPEKQVGPNIFWTSWFQLLIKL